MLFPLYYAKPKQLIIKRFIMNIEKTNKNNFIHKLSLNIKKSYKAFERTFGSMKFAVIIIGVFAISLVIGTFQESWHGADYANRLIYKSWWFMGLQLMMFMSILVATIVRLPFRKSLYGFYTIHTGLLTLFIGSFVTYTVGIDGSVELLPNNPSKKIIVNKYFLKIALLDKKKGVRFPLPYTYKQVKMEGNYKDMIKVVEYIPFSKIKTIWKASNMPKPDVDQGSKYLIFNDNMSQDFTLSLNPNSDFKSTQKLGLLSVHYMPASLYNCFIKESKSGFLFWNTDNGECFTAEEKNLPSATTKQGNRFIVYKYQGQDIKFFPDFSPMAVNDDLSKNSNVPLRVFSRNLFSEKPNLFIFGDKVSFYQKRKSRWVGHEFKGNSPVKLPWMKFKLRLLEHHKGKTPYQLPVYTKPIQDKGQIILGDIQAVKVEIMGHEYWVRSDAPLALSNGESQIRFSIGPKEIHLPFQITLKKFKMQKNPGTNTPASYESFVSLFDSRTDKSAIDAHVYMNNPLKFDEFTFYQSSFFPVGPQTFASVFSANYDPGRPLKYLGSILLVFGSIWHFIIRRRKKKLTKDSHA